MAVDAPRVVMDPRAIQAFINDGGGPVVRDLLVRGDRVKTEAKRLVGKKTHNLENRIVKRIISEDGVPVVQVGVVGVSYAFFHHEGTEPHVIRARRARVLAFYSPREGRTIFTKQVNHPGTKPNRFLVNALRVA